MGNQIKNKLHSQTGASLVMALLFLVVALTLGAIVLTAASANASRVRRGWEDQQKYLALKSAVDLLKQDFANMGFEGSYTHTETYKKTVTRVPDGKKPPQYTTHTTESTTHNYEAGDCPLTGSRLLGKQGEDAYPLQPDFQQAYLYYYVDKTSPDLGEFRGSAPSSPLELPLTLEATPTGGTEDLPQVTGRLQVLLTEQNCFTIQAELAVKEGEKLLYTTNLEFPVTVEQETLPPVVTETTFSTEDSSTTTRIIETTYQARVRWEEPVIRKGALE